MTHTVNSDSPNTGAPLEVDSVAIADSVDRALSRLTSGVWILLILGLASRDFQRIGAYDTWWLVLTAISFVPVVVNMVFARVLPMTVLRTIWIVTPLFGFVRVTLASLAYNGDAVGPSGLGDPAQTPWVIASAFSVYLIFWMRRQTAVVVVLATSFLPLVSTVLAGRALTSADLVNVPLSMALFAFVAIFSGRRNLMLRFRTLEEQARAAETNRLRAAAAAEQHARFVRLVHDEVLSSLTAALRFEGKPPQLLREQAGRVLSVLGGRAFTASGMITCEALGQQLRALIQGIDPATELQIQCDNGELHTQTADVILAAAGEALRNSVRHAGDTAQRTVRATISPAMLRVEIEDDGVGFALAAIADDRIGVRRSILGAAAAAEGVAAEIRTAPGEGSKVVLVWRA